MKIVYVLNILLLTISLYWVFKIFLPLTKLIIEHIRYQKSYKKYVRRSEIIMEFLKNDVSNNKLYQKEMTKYLEILYNHLTKTTSDNYIEESEEIFNLFKDIIPEFRQENRDKKLKQILK